jgi:hypothetical protein
VSVSSADLADGVVLTGSQFSEPMRVVDSPTAGDGLISIAVKRSPFSGNGVAPLPGGQLLELCLELAWGGRRGQKQSDNAEAKMRPPLVGSRG